MILCVCFSCSFSLALPPTAWTVGVTAPQGDLSTATDSRRGRCARSGRRRPPAREDATSSYDKHINRRSRSRTELEEEFEKRGETLDKEKEAELKRLVDEILPGVNCDKTVKLLLSTISKVFLE